MRHSWEGWLAKKSRRDTKRTVRFGDPAPVSCHIMADTHTFLLFANCLLSVTPLYLLYYLKSKCTISLSLPVWTAINFLPILQETFFSYQKEMFILSIAMIWIYILRQVFVPPRTIPETETPVHCLVYIYIPATATSCLRAPRELPESSQRAPRELATPILT